LIDSGLVGVTSGEVHKTRRCRGVTYPESYITKNTTHTKKFSLRQVREKARESENASALIRALALEDAPLISEVSLYPLTGRGGVFDPHQVLGPDVCPTDTVYPPLIR